MASRSDFESLSLSNPNEPSMSSTSTAPTNTVATPNLRDLQSFGITFWFQQEGYIYGVFQRSISRTKDDEKIDPFRGKLHPEAVAAGEKKKDLAIRKTFEESLGVFNFKGGDKYLTKIVKDENYEGGIFQVFIEVQDTPNIIAAINSRYQANKTSAVFADPKYSSTSGIACVPCGSGVAFEGVRLTKQTKDIIYQVGAMMDKIPRVQMQLNSNGTFVIVN